MPFRVLISNLVPVCVREKTKEPAKLDLVFPSPFDGQFNCEVKALLKSSLAPIFYIIGQIVDYVSVDDA